MAPGSTSSRSRSTSSVVRSSWGSFGDDGHHRRVPGRRELGRGHDGHVAIGRDGPLDTGQGCLSGVTGGGGGCEDEGSVEAGAKALGEAVVGDAGGGAGAVVAVVGLTEAQRCERQGEEDEHERAQARRCERSACDHSGPAREALRGLHVPRPLGAQPARERSHQSGQHGDRAHGHHRDDDRRAEAHLPDKGDAGGEQAGDGHHHDRPRRHDGRAGGGVRHTRGVGDAVAARELLSIAPDYQERVVDPRAEPKHDAERGREAREVREGARELQQQQAARQGDQRRDQGEGHRRNRPKHEREHDDRHGHADQLADRGSGLLGLVHDRAVAGNLETGAVAELRGLLEPVAGRRAERGGGAVVLNRDVGDATALGELAALLAEWGRRARHVRLGTDLLDRPLDCGSPFGLA